MSQSMNVMDVKTFRNQRFNKKRELKIGAMLSLINNKDNKIAQDAFRELMAKTFISEEFHLTKDVLNTLYEKEASIKETDEVVGFTSKALGFLVIVDYICEEDVEYNIYVPYDYLDVNLGIASMDDFIKLLDFDHEDFSENLRTRKGFSADEVRDYMACNIRDVVESEVIEFLQSEGILSFK